MIAAHSSRSALLGEFSAVDNFSGADRSENGESMVDAETSDMLVILALWVLWFLLLVATATALVLS